MLIGLTGLFLIIIGFLFYVVTMYHRMFSNRFIPFVVLFFCSWLGGMLLVFWLVSGYQ